MKTSILVTGVSGAGKTALSLKLREMGYAAYDLEEIPGLYTMFDKRTGEPMVEQNNEDFEKVQAMDWICNVAQLKEILDTQEAEIAFYCGNASNMDELIPLFSKMFVLSVGEEATRARLSTRTGNDFARLPHIQDWIFTWKGDWEKEMVEKGGILIDAHKSLEEVAIEVVQRSAE